MNQKKKGIDLNKDPKKLLAIAVENRRKIAVQKVNKQSDTPTTVRASQPINPVKQPTQQQAIRKTVSIKQGLLQQQKAATVTTSATKEESPKHIPLVENLELNVENIKQQLTRFVEQKNKGERLRVELLAGDPKLTDSNIILSSGNKLQFTDLKGVQTELQNYLQRVFNNTKLHIYIQEPEKTITQKVFNDTDRFKEMCKKNPVLAKLKQTFYLDFDY